MLESEFFRRIEKKYKLTKEEYEKMKLLIDREFNEDKHGMSTICNLYFDSDDFILVRRSIEKPIYKEKVRLRSYQVPSYNSNVYLEIKKKYKGIVNKRRIIISTEDIKKYLNDECEVKDYVYIKNSNIKVEASGDGIKSTNTNSEDVGYVIINDSTVDITSGTDGIDAKGSIYTNGGKFNIVTGGSSSNSQDKDTWGKWDKNEFGKGNMKLQDPESSNDSTDTPSAKGIKSVTNILIDSGEFNINSSDDSIHSNNTIKIENGTYEISSGDDGIHADSVLTINDGNINIKKSYEGCETAVININGGNLVAIGSSGMMQAPSSSSSQYSLAFVLSSNYSENSVITIKDSSGDEVLNITAKKLYKSVVFSSSKIKKDETYTIYIDGTESGSLTASSITTTNGKTNNMGMTSPNDGGNRPGGPRK